MGEENLVQDWINNDPLLFDTLVKIQQLKKTKEEQAVLAFQKIPAIYNLPQLPEDNEDAHFTASVYENMGFLNYLEPDGDPRGHVLLSILYVKDYYQIEEELIFIKKYGTKEPKSDFIGFGFKGEGIEVSIVFIQKDECWLELGCTYFVKYE